MKMGLPGSIENFRIVYFNESSPENLKDGGRLLFFGGNWWYSITNSVKVKKLWRVA